MTRNKIFMLIGGLQVISLINIMPYYIRLAPHLVAHINIFDQSNTPFLSSYCSQLVLFLLITVSIILYFRQQRIALRLYYFEFIIRVILFTTSFGFLLRLNYLVKSQNFYHTMTIAVLVLEILRLLVSLILDAKWKKGS
jgi:hypothetical protein